MAASSGVGAGLVKIIDNALKELGCPNGLTIQSDNAKEFTSGALAAHLETLGIKQVHSHPYHPQALGVVKWTNGDLKKGILEHLYKMENRITLLSMEELNGRCTDTFFSTF